VGAQYIVAAVVTALDNDTLVQERLIDVKKLNVLTRRDMKASDAGGEALRAVSDTAKLVLQPLFADGRVTLKLAIAEEGANVLVDGKQVGVSPVDEIGLSGGWHLVSVTKQGFITWQETLRGNNGEVLERTVAMRPSVEFVKEWRAKNGLYRTLAWTTTGLTVAAATAFGATGYLYLDAAQRANAVRDQNEKIIKEENIVSGSATVSVPYAGPLEQGMTYQFRATSIKQGGAPASTTEDLRGVFTYAGD
jgi:hypothetical protein